MAGANCIAPAQAASPNNPLGTGPEAVAAGHVIFNRTCTACHGTDGAEGERAPALVGDRRFFRLSENAIFDTIKNGILGTAMPALGLPDDDIWRIVVFIRAMRASASDVDVPGDAEMTEYWELNKEPNGDQWLVVSTIVHDPMFLFQDWVTSLHFKKEPDGAKWDPQPCSARW